MKLRINILKELIHYLKESNIPKVYEMFKVLDETNNIELQKENNLYLYILSFITEVPDEYIIRLSNIKYEDLLINSENNRYEEISTQNKIRTNIFRTKFYEAKEMIEKTTYHAFINETERELLLTLVKLANEKEKQSRVKIESLVKNKEYSELMSFLEKRKEIRKLNIYETYIYVITAAILRIIKINKIPRVINQNPTNIKEAILGYNFKEALVINKKDIATKYEDSKYVINLLLIEINKLINKVINEYRIKLENEKRMIIDNLNRIKEELSKGNIELSLELILDFLKHNNKEEYLYLIEKLIKISLLSNDSAYKKVLTILNLIAEGRYAFDIKFFYSEFHNSINKNYFDIAQLYLEIIKYYQPQYKEDLTDKELEKMTTNLDYNKEENNFLLSELSKLKKDNEYIEILKKIPQKRRKTLIRIANGIKDLSASSIGNKEPKNLVLRRINPELKIGKEKDLMAEAMNMYINKQYNIAILLYMRLLTSLDYVNVKVCEMLGLSYLHLNERKEALKYLKISKQFVKGFHANRNGIDRLIDLLEKEETEENNKKIDYFLERYDGEVVDFNIEKLEEIAKYMKENNMRFEEAIQKFELVPSQILIIKLIYARYYYTEGMILSGDQILQEVEKTKQKTEPVIAMLNEIRENKQFYQNRKYSYTKKLTEQ